MAPVLPVICPPFCAKPGAIFGSGETDYVDLNQSTSPGQFVSSTRITGSARPKQANPGEGCRLRWLREPGSAHLKCGIRDSDTRLRQRRHSGSVADAAGIDRRIVHSNICQPAAGMNTNTVLQFNRREADGSMNGAYDASCSFDPSSGTIRGYHGLRDTCP